MYLIPDGLEVNNYIIQRNKSYKKKVAKEQ